MVWLTVVVEGRSLGGNRGKVGARGTLGLRLVVERGVVGCWMRDVCTGGSLRKGLVVKWTLKVGSRGLRVRGRVWNVGDVGVRVVPGMHERYGTRG